MSAASLRDRLRAWCSEGFRPIPASGREWFFMRLLFAVVVWVTLQDSRPFTLTGQPHPVGIAYILPLDFLSLPGARAVCLGAAALCLLLYIAGRGIRWTLLFVTVLSILTNSRLNSQGFVLHAYQIVTLTLLGQTVVAFYLHRKNRAGTATDEAYQRGQMIFYSQGIILGTYVVAAISKIINSRGTWLWNSKHLAAELVKSHRQVYYQHLDPAIAGEIAPALWLQAHPLVAQLVFGFGFVLELLALVGLRNRVWGLAIGLAIIGMHRGIYWLMRLEFPYNEWLVLIFLVNLPFWIARAREARATAT